MILVTCVTVGMGLWIFQNVAGDLEDVQINAAVMIQALAATAPPPGVRATAAPLAATATPAPTPTPAALVVTLNAVGQINLDSTLRKSGALEDGGFDYDEIFTDIKAYLGRADVTLVTLESAVIPDAALDTYNAPVEILTALNKAGVNIINVGTEHILDKGLEGLAATRETAERMGFDVIGASRSAEEQGRLLLIDVKGVKIACLSYVYGLSSTGAKKGNAQSRAYSVNLLEADRVVSDVQRVRQQGAQLVVVNVHWGKRSNTRPNAEVTKLTEQIAASGADVILGTHPTSVQTFERRWVTLADGAAKEVFIAYSLGNFLTNERDEASAILGTVLSLQFTLDPGANQVRLSDARYLPTWVMRYQTNSKYHYRIVPAGKEAQPAEMTNSVFRNMRRAYEDLLKRVGQEAAVSYAE
jgi:poly-gamma-glutamate synthesis protein (capsule biosynthesis protein)